MFSFTGRNICQSLRSIISTLFYVHSLCLCWVHTCVFSLLLGEEEKVSKLFVSLWAQEERRGQEDYSMNGKINSAMRYSSKHSSNRFNEITTQLWCNCFWVDKNLGSTSQKTILSNMGMLPTLVKGKQMTQYGTTSLQTVSDQSHSSFSFNSKSLLYGERLQDASPPLAHFHDMSLLLMTIWDLEQLLLSTKMRG